MDTIQTYMFDINLLVRKNFNKASYLIKPILLIKGKLQERGSDWKFTKKDDSQPKEWETKITEIQLLEDVYEKLITNIVIKTNAEDINQLSANILKSIVSENKGNVSLFFEIKDPFLKKTITLRSKKKIKLDEHFIETIEEIENLSFECNKKI